MGYSCYHLDVSVEESGHEIWRLTCVYGEAQTHLRYRISTSSSLPWMCIGDFNEVLCSSEHVGIGMRSNAQIQAFRDTVDICMLIDIGYKGRQWTFEKRVAGGTYTRCRLDRELISDEMSAQYP